MFHYFSSITNTKGDALIGYLVQAIDPASGSVASIYADESSTPIITVSGVANMAQVDTDGNVSFWIEGGTYHLDIYATNGTTLVKRVLSIPMMNGAQGEPGAPGVDGLPGERPVYSTWADLSAVTGSATASAEVPLTDTGTHTDPVTAATVSNSGIFSWSDAPAGWRRVADVDALSAKPYADEAAASAAAVSAAAAAKFVFATKASATANIATPAIGDNIQVLADEDYDGAWTVYSKTDATTLTFIGKIVLQVERSKSFDWTGAAMAMGGPVRAVTKVFIDGLFYEPDPALFTINTGAGTVTPTFTLPGAARATIFYVK